MNGQARRGAVTAATVAALSVSGHLLGGGATPHPVAVALVLILASLLGAVTSVSSGPWRPRVGVPLLAAFQVAAHTILHGVAGAAPVPTSALLDPRHAHATPLRSTSDHLVHVASTGGVADHGVSPLMLTTHLLATVLLAWLLGPAVRQVRALVARAVPVLPFVGGLSRPIPVAPLVLLVSRPVGTTVSLRGPPRFVLS